MTQDYTTHFAADERTTLCGLRWQSIIMNDRPARCRACSDAHARAGWSFPLPAVVV